MKKAPRKGRRKDAEARDLPGGESPIPGGESSQRSSWSRFQEGFPHLAAEIEASGSAVRVGGVRWQETERAKTPAIVKPARYARYSPDTIAFVRRCNTEEEALEIIAFMEQRREIDAEYAKALRHQLRMRGLRSFGPKKTWGHYERED